MSSSPSRFRRRSFLNDPPAESPNLPSGSILLNGNGSTSNRDSSPGPFSMADDDRSETESIATRASTQSVSFAPLPVIPPELKRRSSITLGVAARKNLLSSPEDEIYPDPRRKAGGGQAGGVQKVYMNDADWEEYKRHHDEKNGNNPVDLGDLVTNGAKNLWRKVKSSPSPSQKPVELGTSPTPSTSSLASTSARTGSSPGVASTLLSNITSPRISVRRRGSDPGNQAPGTGSMGTTTKSPDLVNIEEESLSRMQSAEPPLAIGTGTSPGTSAHVMDWRNKSSVAASNQSGSMLADAANTVREREIEGEPRLSDLSHPDSHIAPPSPPPRVQDVLPSTDEIKENHDSKLREGNEREARRTQNTEEREDTGGALGLDLEKSNIRQEGEVVPEWKQDWSSSKRDSAVLGFDRRRYGGGRE